MRSGACGWRRAAPWSGPANVLMQICMFVLIMFGQIMWSAKFFSAAFLQTPYSVNMVCSRECSPISLNFLNAYHHRLLIACLMTFCKSCNFIWWRVRIHLGLFSRPFEISSSCGLEVIWSCYTLHLKMFSNLHAVAVKPISCIACSKLWFWIRLRNSNAWSRNVFEI